jgi:hypothetical protein
MFLLGHFELLLGAVEQTVSSKAMRIRWHAGRTRVYDNVGSMVEAARAAQVLRGLLTSSPPAEESKAVQLGWTALLLHASATGNAEAALEAATNISPDPIHPQRRRSGWRHFAVLNACLRAGHNPLPYLERIVPAAAAANESLWQRSFGFDLWMSVGATLCFTWEGAFGDHRMAASRACQALLALAQEVRTHGNHEVALVLEATASRIQIDLVQDFAAATRTAEQLIAARPLKDPRIRTPRTRKRPPMLRALCTCRGCLPYRRSGLAGKAPH